MPIDPQYRLSPEDLIDPGATGQDDQDPDIAEWADSTSEWDFIDAAQGIPRPTDDDGEGTPGPTGEQARRGIRWLD